MAYSQPEAVTQPANPAPQSPPCPTCVSEKRLADTGTRAVAIGGGVWLCKTCGTEYTLDLSLKPDPKENRSQDTKLLRRLPPEVFIG